MHHLLLHRPTTRPTWLVVLAALSMFALLVLFRQVVSGAVDQGQLRHEATARHSAASWRCTALRSMRQRDDCLAELNAPPPTVTLLRAAPQ